MSDHLLGVICVGVVLGGPIGIAIWALVYGAWLNWNERDLW